MLAGPLARVQEHVFDDGVGPLAVLHDFFQIRLQHLRQFADLLPCLLIKRDRRKRLVQFSDQLGRQRGEIMSALYFYDDVRARQFEPFALTRPGSEMRAGTSLIRRRWERATSMESAGFISSPHLAHFEEGKAPPAVARQ